MVGYSQWLQWVLQDAFTGLVLGGIVVVVAIVGFIYSLLRRVFWGE